MSNLLSEVLHSLYNAKLTYLIETVPSRIGKYESTEAAYSYLTNSGYLEYWKGFSLDIENVISVEDYDVIFTKDGTISAYFPNDSTYSKANSGDTFYKLGMQQGFITKPGEWEHNQTRKDFMFLATAGLIKNTFPEFVETDVEIRKEDGKIMLDFSKCRYYTDGEESGVKAQTVEISPNAWSKSYIQTFLELIEGKSISATVFTNETEEEKLSSLVLLIRDDDIFILATFPIVGD